MKNRAKCKICKLIIESLHQHDYVACQCGEIAINGGSYDLWVFAKDYSNFLRIDDQGNEIEIKVREKNHDLRIPLENAAMKEAYNEAVKEAHEATTLSKKEKIEMLLSHIQGYETRPQLMDAYVTNYDLYAALLNIYAIFKEEE